MWLWRVLSSSLLKRTSGAAGASPHRCLGASAYKYDRHLLYRNATAKSPCVAQSRRLFCCRSARKQVAQTVSPCVVGHLVVSPQMGQHCGTARSSSSTALWCCICSRRALVRTPAGARTRMVLLSRWTRQPAAVRVASSSTASIRDSPLPPPRENFVGRPQILLKILKILFALFWVRFLSRKSFYFKFL